MLPSRSEPFGIVVAEALACGCAVIASRIGGIPEIVVDGESGILVEPDDQDALARAVSRVLDDGALRRALAEAGRARALRCFGADSMGAGYERLYTELFDSQLGQPTGG